MSDCLKYRNFKIWGIMDEVIHCEGNDPIEPQGESMLSPLVDLPEMGLPEMLKRIYRRSDTILARAADVIGAAAAMATGEESRFVVDLPEDILAGIRDGSIKLDRDKAGNLYAQIRKNGRYGDKFSIHEEVVDSGMSPAEVGAAAQMAAIRAQLEAVADTLSDIGQDVGYMIEGQRTDREALCDSGESLLLQASSAEDPMFKKMLAAQAIKSLSDGQKQLEKDFETNVAMLKEGFGRKGARSMVEKADACVASLHRDFAGIHRSASLVIATYFQLGEPRAMAEAVRSYGRFIESEIIPNRMLITEYDKDDSKLVGGVWEERATALSTVENMGRALASSKAVTLLLESGDCNEE